VRRVALLLLAALVALGPPTCAHAAPRPPVVVVVLDEFPSADLVTRTGQLDSRRFPGFAALAGGATWFPDAYAVHDSTRYSVPAILTGRRPRAGTGPSYVSHPHSLFTLMARLGYRIHAREEGTTICPPRLCPRTDHYGNPHYNPLHLRRERFEQTIASLRRTRRPVFTFHHSILPHVPWVYLPSGRNRQGYPPGALPDFASPAGFGDPFLTEFNEQRHLLQVGFADREIGRLVARLKHIGQWRRALVVVTADHGISFDVGATDRRTVSDQNVHEVAPVPLFVKPPGQTRGRVSRAYANGTDVVPTIARLLHAIPGYPVDGGDAFGTAVARRPGVDIDRRDLSGRIVVPAAQIEARRRADWARRADLFGDGPWWRVYRIGPHRQLLGRRVAIPATAPASARFTVPRGLGHVDPRARAVPTLAAGRIVPGSAAGGQDLALAVNGRIAAVGRSFHLAGVPTEWFALDVPESALRRGADTMALYGVTASGDRTSLRLLGVDD
jgi:hypothetical protein